MEQAVAESPSAPLWVRLLLLALLPVIGIGLYLDGQRQDPDQVPLKARQAVPSPDLFPSRLAGLDRAGPVRHYSRDNLYEYINGHAEYFLSAGFNGLAVAEYGPQDSPSLVVNLYDLGAPLNAFGVLADEAGERDALDLGALGFMVGKGASFIRGPYYVQLSPFAPDLPLLEAGRTLDANLARQVTSAKLDFRFPDLGQVKGTRYVKESYQGLDFLGQVLERRYERDGAELRVFLVTGSAEQIQALVAAFEHQFRLDQAPVELRPVGSLTFHLVQDRYEGDWFFLPLADRLLGVFGALDAPLERELAQWAGQEPVAVNP